nr:MAG TPA: hypothetical protein [Caudoviricetes sp.]
MVENFPYICIVLYAKASQMYGKNGTQQNCKRYEIH